MDVDKEIQAAIKLLNDNNYVVIPIQRGQMYLSSHCEQPQTECRYCTLGYTCSNLLCINDYIKEQLDLNQLQITEE